MSRLLPLFPLQLVVFPASSVPLHIFEERYREMVGAAEASGSEFGIVLAKDGGIVNSGCTVVVEKILHRYPDGRFDVLTRGQRRFSILSIDEEKAYLQGEVEYFGDEDVTPPAQEVRTRALDAFERMRVALQAGGAEVKGEVPDANDPFLSFHLAQTVDDLDFQNLMQRSRSEADRLRQFAEFMEQYVPQREYVAKMKRAAPTNGFGHKPASM
jgi:ATP-dependent Lon protease